MYYLFVAKDLHITAYIGKKVNNTIAKCNIKLVREINSYRVCYTDTLINLNVVTIYKLGDSELIYKFIEDVKAITEIELELLNKINYCINNDKSFKVSNLRELRKLDQYIIYSTTDYAGKQYHVNLIDFNNNNFINLCYNYDKEYKISKSDCYNYDKEYKISKSDYIFDFPDVYKNYKVIIIDNAFDFIPIDFFRKKQFTTDFMEYLVSLSLNEFDIKYFSK